MKFELEEKELEMIEKINRDIKEGEDLDRLIFKKPGGVFSISFTVKDVAKANLFISNLLFNGKETIKNTETFGVEFTSLNFSDNIVLDSLEERLQLMLDFVREMKGEHIDGN